MPQTRLLGNWCKVQIMGRMVCHVSIIPHQLWWQGKLAEGEGGVAEADARERSSCA